MVRAGAWAAAATESWVYFRREKNTVKLDHGASRATPGIYQKTLNCTLYMGELYV